MAVISFAARNGTPADSGFTSAARSRHWWGTSGWEIDPRVGDGAGNRPASDTIAEVNQRCEQIGDLLTTAEVIKRW